jgi:hypothetical protein
LAVGLIVALGESVLDPQSREPASRNLERTNRSRSTAATAAAGICGIVAAIESGGLLPSRASPDQLPGYARTIGLDPRTDLARLFLLLLLPLLAGIGARRLRSVRFRATHSGLAAATANAILAWSLLAGPAAACGWRPLHTAPILLLLSIAEGLWIGRGKLDSGSRCFAMSTPALAIALWGSRPASVSWVAGLASLALPLTALAWKQTSVRRREVSRSIVNCVLLPGSFVALAAASCLRLPPVADVFEDGHGLLPASEYFRGEKPFRDILPGHGFLSDGGIQFASLKAFGDDYAGLRRGMKVVGALFWPAVYFVGFAATGQAAIGFWTLLLSFLWFPQYMFFRVIASLFVLALACAACRTGRRGLWIAAGAALPFAILSAVDFAGFAAAACAAAIVVSRRGWRRSLPGFALGFFPGAILSAGLLALAGGLPSFFSSFIELRSLMPVYAQGFHVGPAEIRRWLGGCAFLFDPESFFGLALIGSALTLAIIASRFPQMGQRARALAPVLSWFVAATVSVIERHHIGYAAFVLPIAVVLTSRWIVGWSPWSSIRGSLAAACLAAMVFCAKPVNLAAAVADALERVRVPSGSAELKVPPRARGALFPLAQQTVILRTGEFLRSGALGPSDTWLDFANAPGLYYLFNRDCPIREYEVPFYETRVAQEAVIRALEGNRRIRAVLIRTGLSSDAIDGIPNAQRAPLVFRYVSRAFHVGFSKDGVEFWVRDSLPLASRQTAGRADQAITN